MSNMLSGKVKKVSPTAVSVDRYNFLRLSEAEPDLGVPATSGYILSSDTAGARSWIALNQIVGGSIDGTVIGGALPADGKFRLNQSSQSIVTGIYLQSGYSSTGALSAISSFTSTGNQPAGLAVHPTGKFAYVANYGTVSQFSLNQTTGVPTSITTAIASNAGTGCSGIVVDPTGKYLYVTNYEVNTVSQFSINQTTGALTVITTAVSSGTFPFDIAVDPSGKYVYVANQGAGTVSQYSINLNGGLSNLASAISTGASTAPSGIAVDPTGRFAYVGTYTGNSIAQFSINQTTGALTSIGTPIATGASTAPSGIAVDPSGKFVYAVLEGNDTLAQFSINQTTGVLTSIDTPIATGSSPKKVVVDPTGRFAYVSNYGGTTVSQYSINQTTGALTSITTAITTGSGPIGIAVDPTGRFVYTASAGGSARINLHTINNFSAGQSTVNSSSFLKSTSTATGALVVTGGVGISENLYLGGNLNLGGTITGNNSGTLVVSSPIQIDTHLVVDAVTATTTATTANQVLTTLDATVYRVAKFLIRAVDATSGKYHTTELLAIHNGTTANCTEYGAINMGGVCATFNVDYYANTVRLLTTPASANSTVFTVAVQLLK